MKSFRYNHSIAVWILLGVIILSCGAGAVINVINAVHNLDNTVKMVGHIIIAAITFVLFVLSFSVAISSKYYVKNDNVVLAVGIAKSIPVVACRAEKGDFDIVVHNTPPVVSRQNKILAGICFSPSPQLKYTPLEDLSREVISKIFKNPEV